MPRFTGKNADGDEIVIETAIPSEAAALRNQGFTEQAAKTKAVKEQEKSLEENSPAPKAEAKKS